MFSSREEIKKNKMTSNNRKINPLLLMLVTLLVVAFVQIVSTASAQLTATKVASIIDVAGGTPGVADSGETIHYVIEVTNPSTGNIDKVHVSDQVDTNTTLDNSSITIVNGSGALDFSVPGVTEVTIDDIPAGETVSVEYDVVLDCDTGATEVRNQGSISWDDGSVSPPINHQFFTDDPSTAAADDQTVVSAVNTTCASLGNLVFKDTNGNDVFDGTDTGVDGVTVNLYTDNDQNGVLDNGGVAYATTVTAGGGLYSFSDLPEAYTYQLGFVPMASMPFVTPDSGSDETIDSDVTAAGLTGFIDLASGENNVDYDAGVEPAETTVTVTKTDAITSTALDAGDTVTYTVLIENDTANEALKVNFADVLDSNTTLDAGSVTTSHGSVTTGNTAGDTTVVVNADDVPGNDTVTITFEATMNDVCGITSISNQGTASGNNFDPTNTDDPDTATADDATETTVDNPCEATIGDKVYKDANDNGIQDSGESGQNGVTVELYVDADADGIPDSATPVATDVTAGGGIYGFTVNDVSTNYVLRFVPMTSMPFTTNQNVGTDDTIDSDVDANGYTATISVSDGDVITDIDAGMIDPDTVVTITKTDSLSTSVEPGDTITYTVVLTNTTAIDAHDAIFTDSPDANTSLVNGTVSVSPAAGTTITTGNTAGDTTVEVDVGTIVQGTPVTITFDVIVDSPLASGVTQVANQGVVDGTNFGPVSSDDPDTITSGDETVTPVVLPTASLGNRVWKDTVIENGLQDSGEAGVDGVTVNLWTDDDGNGTPDTQILTTMTAGGGFYSFTGLDSTLDYILQFVPMASMPYTSDQDVGSDDTIDSDVDAAGLTGVINLAPGENNTDYDAGMIDADTVVTIEKTDAILNNTGSSVLEPDETVRYTVVIENTTAIVAHNAIFTDILDANTTLVVGSVVPSQGVATTGNAAGDTSIAVNLGDIAGNGSVTITFDVTLNNPIASTVTEISNQGTVAGDNFASVVSNDPDSTAIAGEPTITEVSDPKIGIAKALTSAVSNANGTYTVSYDILVANLGNSDLNSLQITDDLGTTFTGATSITVDGITSSDLSEDSAYSGITTGTNLLLGNDTLAVGETGTVSITATLELPATAGLGPFVNSASVSGTSPYDIVISDTSQNGTSVDSDSDGDAYDNNEPTPVTFTALDTASLGNLVFKDANENGIQDTSEVGQDGVTVELYLDADNNGIADSVTPLQTDITSGGGFYSFTGLDTTSNFVLRFVPMASMPFTLQYQGTDDTADSDVNADGYTGTIDLAAGENNIDYDAGMIDADTVLTVTKVDSIPTNTGSTALEPDEVVRYTVVVTNTTAIDAHNVIFTDTLDANTTLVVGSVNPGPGTVTTGNGTGDTTVEVDLGDIAGNGSATIIFDAILNNPIASTVTEISNQGTVSGDNFGTVSSDDPDTTGVDGDSTNTLVSDPKVGIAKELVSAVSNANGSYTVEYDILVENLGNSALSALQITDDLGSTFTGATSITVDAITSSDLSEDSGYTGMTTGTSLLTGADTLAVGATGTVSITVTVELPATAGLGPFNNSAIVSGTSPFDIVISDTSQNGTNVDSDSDGNAFDNNEPTPVTFSALDTASLGNLVFKDTNENGIQDTGEVGQDGVTVELYLDSDNNGIADSATPLQTDVTSSGGFYSFTGLDTTSNFVLRFVPMASMPFTLQDQGTDDTADSDVNADGYTGTIDLAAGENNIDYDAGMTDADTVVTITKTDGLSTAIDAGDTITYTVVLTNTTAVDAHNAIFTDTPDANTSLVDGTVVVTPAATITAGNTTGDTSVEVAIGDIVQDTPVTITFDVIVDDPLASGVTQISNQGTVDGDNFGPVSSDDPDTTDATDPTVTLITTAPVDTTLVVTKVDAVFNVDTGASDLLEPDEIVHYSVKIQNTTDVTATDVIFTDIPDINTTLQNSVQSSQGTVVTGNNAGDTSIEVNIGDIAPGDEVVIVFNAYLNNPIPATVTEIQNQGTVDGTNIPVTLTDDPNTGAASDPTATPVSDPRIGLSKAVVGTPTSNSDGSHTVTYEMTVSNMGNRPLNNVQITDDLGSTFVGGPSIVSASVSSTTLTTNNDYNGLGNTNLLAGTDSLAVGASGTLTLTVNVRLNTGPLGAYNNSAITSGTTPESVTVSDTSQDGSSVDPDDNGNPYDNNDPTPVTFEEAAVAASIALAKSATLTTDVDSNGASVYRITYDFIVTNNSDVALDSVQVEDDLVATVAGLNFSLIGTSASSTLTENPNYDGINDKNLLSGEDTLAANASGTIKLEISIPVSEVTAERSLSNTATVFATGPEDTGVSDVSQSGTNPDPDGDGAGNNSEATVVRLEPVTTPTNPVTEQSVRVQKVVLNTEYQIGSAIQYRITLINDSTAGPALTNITDTPDKFLRYIPNSTEVRKSGVTEVQSLEPTVSDGVLSWTDISVPAAAANNTGAVDSGQVEITYTMRVLPGASGKLRNSATILSDGAPIDAAVNVNADIIPGGAGPFSGKPIGTVIGRVFADVDGDRQYTAGVDQPIGGARLILCNGWQVRTDVEGNYTFREVPQGTDCVQLDKHSIPFEVDKGNLSSGSGYVQMMQSFGVSTNNFVLKVGTGSVTAVRETTVVYGPITVVKRHFPLESGNVRVVLAVEVSDVLPYGITITDRIPDAAQPTVWDLMTTQTFDLSTEAKHYEFDYELPANAPMTDLELAPTQ